MTHMKLTCFAVSQQTYGTRQDRVISCLLFFEKQYVTDTIVCLMPKCQKLDRPYH